MDKAKYGWGPGYGIAPNLETSPSATPYQECAYPISEEELHRLNRMHEMTEESDNF